MLIKTVMITLINCCIISGLNAQSIIAPAGNHASAPSVSLNWTLGEPVINNHAGTKTILNPGFLQTGLMVTPIKETYGLKLQIKAYPNPANELIFLETEEYETLSWYLYDIKGKLLKTKIMESRITEIPVHDMIPANYLLKIKKRGNEVKTFKIAIME